MSMDNLRHMYAQVMFGIDSAGQILRSRATERLKMR